MVRFNSDEIHHAMEKRQNIRNIAIVAHVDSGKTTCTDSLLNKAGIISAKDTGEKRGTDTREDEQARCITIKSTGVSLYYEMPETIIPKESDGNGFLINLIDSPGHVDFSSEVTAALRVADGSVIIIDAVKGVSVQTETVIRQSLDEMIQPVSMINNIDRLMFELKLEPEDLYMKLYGHVSSLNQTISRYNQKMPDIELDPRKGTVTFGCGLMGWGFSLNTMARKWTGKVNMTEDELVQKMWGDNFYNPKKKKWYTENGKGRIRGFNYFVMKPILHVVDTIKSNDKDKIDTFLNNIGAKINPEIRQDQKMTLKLTLQQFMPLADSMLEMIILHLPSPITAQSYRVDNLYTGPKDDRYYEAIKNCDPNGPLVMYISKLFPTPDLSRFYAYGRVFSGTISSTDITVQRPEYVVGSKEGMSSCRVQKTVVWMGSAEEAVRDCPAGNTIALAGVDKFITKTATITDKGVTDAYNIKDMQFSVSPVVSVAVKCKKSNQLPKLVKGLALLTKSDPLCQVNMDHDTGETRLSGAGELHLEICVQDLQNMFAKGVELEVSDPVVPFRETIISTSEISCLVKSPNKHNRLFVRATHVDHDLVNALDDGTIVPNSDKKELTKALGTFGISKNEVAKIWQFSLEYPGNFIMDETKGVQYLHEIKDSVTSALSWIAAKGPLCDEPIRGVRFNIEDVSLHADAIHRGGGQIIPTARKVFYGSMLHAQPRLMEPIYLCEIQCPNDVAPSLYGILSQRRGQIIDSIDNHESGMSTIKAHLPVAESIGFTQFLRSQTGGKAFPQCVFSHWELINDDPLVEGTKSYNIVMEVRERKGLKLELPKPTDFLDKM